MDGTFAPPHSLWSVPKVEATRIGMIADGTSNTLAFAEVAHGVRRRSKMRDSRRDCYSPPSVPPLSGGAQCACCYRSQDRGTLSGWNWRGYRGAKDRSGERLQHAAGPNKPCYRPGANGGTGHAGPAATIRGRQRLLCDGSVRFVPDNIDADVWTAAGTQWRRTLSLP